MTSRYVFLPTSKLLSCQKQLADFEVEVMKLKYAQESIKLELSSALSQLEIKRSKNRRLREELARLRGRVPAKTVAILEADVQNLNEQLSTATASLAKTSVRLRETRSALALMSEKAARLIEARDAAVAKKLHQNQEIQKLRNALECQRKVSDSAAENFDQFRDSVGRLIARISAEEKQKIQPEPVNQVQFSEDPAPAIKPSLEAALGPVGPQVTELEGQLKFVTARAVEYARSLGEAEVLAARKQSQLDTVLGNPIWKAARPFQKLSQIFSCLVLYRSLRSTLSNHFDEAWYIDRYPEAALSCLDPLGHLVSTGLADLRDPNSCFSSQWYLLQNPDVAAVGMLPILHFARFGLNEGRDPHPAIDFEEYEMNRAEKKRDRVP